MDEVTKHDDTVVSPDGPLFGNPATSKDNVVQRQPNAVVHTAAPGETLRYIAELYYPGDASDRVVRGLWLANANRVRDVDSLTVGTNVIIPVYDPDWNADEFWDVRPDKTAEREAWWNRKLATPPAL